MDPEFLNAHPEFASLTPEEQKCVSAKIKKLMDEGKSQDQAVAIAISMCAPEKSKSHRAPNAASFSRLPGGKYRARQAPDGTWDVMDVPVFSTVKKGEKGAPRDITRTDLQVAVDGHQRQYHEDSYLARTNVLHNYGVQKARPAGFFLPHSIRPLRFRGQTRPVIFADLLSVPDEVFRQIDRDELPYCSVEVRTYEPLTFGALALLDSEPPYFEFPLISFGKKEFAEVIDAVTVPELGFAAPVALASFKFAEDNPMADDKPDTEKKKDEGQMADGESSDVKSATSAIEDVLKQLQPILDLKDKILALVSGGGEEMPNSEGPVDQPVAAMAALTEAQKEIQRLNGRVAGLEESRERDQRAREKEQRFNNAVSALEAEGYPLMESTRQRIFAQAELGDEAVKALMDTIREGWTQDPTYEFGLVGQSGGSDNYPAEVMAYQGEGPEKFAAAVEEWRVWRTFPDDKHRSPLASYLKREVG